MALNQRQLILYTDRVYIYRKVRNAEGDPVWSRVAMNVVPGDIYALPCKFGTTANVDKNATVGQIKEPGIFVYDWLHCEASTDIRTIDKVHRYDPADPTNVGSGDWSSIVGKPRVRESSGSRRANVSEVYLNPTSKAEPVA